MKVKDPRCHCEEVDTTDAAISKNVKNRTIHVFFILLIAIAFSFSFAQSSHAITITGSDTITKNSSSQYAASGCNGTVTWGVTNPGASINQSTLTTSGACGNVLLAARCSADGAIATKAVRVTDAGQWVLFNTVNNTTIPYPGYTCYNVVAVSGGVSCDEISGKNKIQIYGNCAPVSTWYVGKCSYVGGCNPCPGDGTPDYIYFAWKLKNYYEWQCLSSSCPYNITPQAQEICGDLIDNNCNGEVDEGCGVCADGETKSCAYTGPASTENNGICKAGTQTCANGQWGACEGEVTPVDEVCGDNKDNNCDGNADEGCVVCEDKDGDGYYAISSTCPQGNDCNDNDASVHPGAAEICDGKDNDCNGEIDEGLSTDADGDGHYTSDSCKEPRDDCNDSNATTYPGAEEICGDGIDNNCDGNKDEGCAVDNDGDGYFASPQGDDPNDNDATVYPGAPELCDGKDNNGDGSTDEGCEVCEVGVRISPSEVAPQKTSGNTKADIQISPNQPVPAGGCTIDLNVYPVPYSGGHDHHDALRPHGKLDGSDKLTIYMMSGEIDSVNVGYTSSEVAGTEEITATIRETGEKIINTIGVKVPILGVLGSGDEWRLTGWTTAHQDNHYGEASAINAAMTIARDYFEATEATLGINDMSLEWGGLFDIGPPQGIFWLPPHSSHRKGTSIDIDRNALGPNGGIRVDRIAIGEICKSYGGRLVPEATIHCEIIH